ncbi:MAG TPA: amino acid permease, partial [Phycisphaeraceae bacterium]
NYIMGSRLAYGMARQGLLPAFLGRLHASRRTPHTAILILAGIVLVLALSGNVKDLGKATSLLLLASFAVVNASLLVLQRRPGEPRGGFEVPWLVPAGGILVCLAMIGNELIVAVRGGRTRPLIIAGIIVIGIFVLYGLMRPRNNTEAQAAVPQDPA